MAIYPLALAPPVVTRKTKDASKPSTFHKMIPRTCVVCVLLALAIGRHASV